MTVLTDALNRLLERHRRIGSPVPGYLRPGADASAVRLAVDGLGLDPPPELVELFVWHDGIDNERWVRDGAGTGFARLFGDTHFAPIADAVLECQTARRIAAEAAEQALAGATVPDLWESTWFPAFCGGWETYAVSCSADARLRGRVFDVRWHPGGTDEPIRPRFQHLTSMIESIVRRFDEGAYGWDSSRRFLEEHADVVERLAADEQHGVSW